MNLSKRDREQLRMMFGGRCAYCGCELPAKGWHADHVKPVERSYQYGEMVPFQFHDGPTIMKYESYGGGKKKLKKIDCPENENTRNLWPSCKGCNINKSSMPLEEWRQFLMSGPESLASYNGRFRHMLRFGVVTINPGTLTFWFERYTPEQPAQPKEKAEANKEGES